MNGGRERDDATKSDFSKKAARASWIIVLVNFGVMHFGRSAMEGSGDLGRMIFGGFVAVLFVVGIILGIVGITGWRRHGVKTTIVPGLIGVFSNAAFLFLFSSVAISSYTNYNENAMARISESLNKQLPKMINSETRLDKTTVGPGKRFSYFYTMVNYKGSEFDREDLKQSIGAKIRDSACTEKSLQAFFEKGLTIVYSYSGNDGAPAFEIPVNPSDCGYSQ